MERGSLAEMASLIGSGITSWSTVLQAATSFVGFKDENIGNHEYIGTSIFIKM